ncbi:MAG: hypothetical protein IT501_06630 [Rubrivivax sp.]|jgi:hypothetical protein|nr:hypothetical protein [Rubrivivax sp.]
MFLFFSVARSQENGSWERAAETAQTGSAGALVAKPPTKVAVPKTGANPNFGMNMPLMCSAFDTSMWLNAA